MAKLANPLGSVSIMAAANISKQLFIGLTGNICAANAKSLGVSEYDALSGEMVGVIFNGVALVLAGAAITAGAAVASNAAGKAVAATTLTATVPTGATSVTSTSAAPAATLAGSVLPQQINGYALDAASAADDLIRVLLV
jgi:hypothetical protein